MSTPTPQSNPDSSLPESPQTNDPTLHVDPPTPAGTQAQSIDWEKADSQWNTIKPQLDAQSKQQWRDSSDYSSYLTDIPNAVPEGIANAGIALADLGDKLSSTIFGTEDHHLDKSMMDSTQTKLGGFVSGLTEFAVPFLATEGIASSALKGLKAGRLATALGTDLSSAERAAVTLSRGEKMISGLASGAVADATGFTGQQARLSNLLTEHFQNPILNNSVTQYLAANPDDNWAEARFKQSIEGLGLGLVGEGIFAAGRAVLGLRSAEPAVRKLSIQQLVTSVNNSEVALTLAGKATRIAPEITDQQAMKVMTFAAMQAQETGQTLEKYLSKLHDVRETLDGSIGNLSERKLVNGEIVSESGANKPGVVPTESGMPAIASQDAPKIVGSTVPPVETPVAPAAQESAQFLGQETADAVNGSDVHIPSPENRGFIKFFNDVGSIIYLHRTADVSTFAHEMFHYGRRFGGFTPANLSALEGAVGVTEGKWTTEAEEKAASLYERYLTDGVAPHDDLIPAFNDMQKWMLGVYKSVNNPAIAGEVSPEVRSVFNQMLGFGPETGGKAAVSEGADALAQANRNIPSWVEEEMLQTGRNPNRLLNDVDAARPKTVEQLANDPVTKFLERTDSPLAERARSGDLTAAEYTAALSEARRASTLAQRSILPADVEKELVTAVRSEDPVENGTTVLKTFINDARIGLTDDGMAFKDKMHQVLDDTIFSRRDGVVPLPILEASAKAIAEEHGTSMEKALAFLSKQDAQTSNLSRDVLAGRMINTTFIENAAKLNRLASSTPMNSVLQSQANEAAINAAKILTLSNNTQTEVARTLNGFNIQSRYITTSERLAANTAKFLESGNSVDIARFRRMLATADGERATRGVFQWAEQQATAIGNKALSLHNEFWINSLLGGIKTHVTNLTSQLAQTMLLPLTRIAGGALTADTAAVKSGFRAYANLVHSALDVFEFTEKGLRFNEDSTVGQAVKAWWNETPILDSITKAESGPRFAWTAEHLGVTNPILAGSVDWLGKAIRLPTRMLTGADEFFKQLNYRAWLRDEAYQEAFRQGLEKNPDEFARYVGKYLEDGFDNLGKATSDTALLKAKQATFTQDLVEGSIVKSISDGVQAHPILRTVIPFIKVPTNLLKTARDYTPGINFLFKEFRDQFFNADKMVAADARGRLAVGTAFWSLAGSLAYTGKITGGGPKDPDLRAAKLATGWRPYSFAMQQPDGSTKYVEYKRMEPYAMMFGLSADFTDAAQHLDDQTLGQTATALAISLAKNLTNKTYVTSLAEITNVLANPDPSAEKFIQNRLGSYVPGTAVNLNDDDYLREARTFMDGVLKRVPGYSNTLPPKRDIFGDPINAPTGYAFDTFRYSTRIGDPVKEELAKLQYGFSQPSKKYQGIDLTLVNNGKGSQDAYDYYLQQHGKVKLGGKTMPESLNDLIASDRYKALPDPDGTNDTYNGKVKAVQAVIGRYRDAAAQSMLKQYPQVMQLKRALDQRRRDAQRPTANVLQRLASS